MSTKRRRQVLILPAGILAADALPQLNETCARYDDAKLDVDDGKIVVTTAQAVKP